MGGHCHSSSSIPRSVYCRIHLLAYPHNSLGCAVEWERKQNTRCNDCGASTVDRDITGTSVATVAYTGNTDEEKDCSCAAMCKAHPDCQFWVRATSSTECWLRKDATGESTVNIYRAGYKAGGPDWASRTITSLEHCQELCEKSASCVAIS